MAAPLLARAQARKPLVAALSISGGEVARSFYRSGFLDGMRERFGTLVASGLIVGESLWGVVNAALIVGLSNDAPIGLVPDTFAAAPWLGVIGFLAAIVFLYGPQARAVARRAFP